MLHGTLIILNRHKRARVGLALRFKKMGGASEPLAPLKKENWG
ncbi:MAG: hypothetical protein CM15mP66_00050 [Pseudomonadota bacterium]|nr:MAG: hypothetical protein CM15mP66_00050 [Pseudomonadota bacterium]